MQKVEIIIPKQNNNGESLEPVISQVKMNLCQLFGGFTAFQAEGGWISDEGKLYQEPVTVLVSAVAEDKADEAKLIISIARNVMELTDQLAVFVSINGQAQIID